MAESRPLVRLVFSHTRLGPADLGATASTLVLFSLGMFAWAAQNIVARGFYAARDTLTPAVVGTIFTVLNIPVYWLLVRRFEHLGLALASSIGIIVYTLVLFGLLKRRLPGYQASALFLFFLKFAAVSAAAGLVTFRLTGWLSGHWSATSARGAFVVLILVTPAGALLTLLLAWILRVREVGDWPKKEPAADSTL